MSGLNLVPVLLSTHQERLIEQVLHYGQYHGFFYELSLENEEFVEFFKKINDQFVKSLENLEKNTIHQFCDAHFEKVECFYSLDELFKYYKVNVLRFLEENSAFFNEYFNHISDTCHSFFDYIQTTQYFQSSNMITNRLENSWKSRFGVLFNHPEEGVFVTDKNGVILDINKSYQRITGYNKDEIIGFTPRILKSGRHDRLFYEELWSSLRENGKWAGMIYNKKKDGTIYLEKLNISAVYDENGEIQNYISRFTDQDESENYQKILSNLSRYDALTGLINKEVFNVRLNRAIARCKQYKKKFSIILIDLDNFNAINNTYGQRYGDMVLKQVAKRLKDHIRVQDTLARYGGDEFIILYECDETTKFLKDFGNDILDSISAPMQIENEEFILTSSVGIGVFPDDGKDTETLIKNVHIASSQSKKKGSNFLMFYNANMTDAVKEKLALTHDLHLAIEREEFELHYQPLITTLDQKVIGVEALIRWNHPQKGYISPLEFISVAEETQQIISIGDWVLRTACKQLKEWHDNEVFNGYMSINVSGIQLLKSGFVDKIKEILDESGVCPHKVELEITETQMMDHMDRAIETLEAIQKLGVRISIDDFGTGYSSLGHLRKLPINKLKIDRQFIKEIQNSSDDQEISKAIISMAKALNLDVLAEGIEAKEQLHYLLAQGCELGQGYYFSKPLAKDKFVSFMSANS